MISPVTIAFLLKKFKRIQQHNPTTMVLFTPKYIVPITSSLLMYVAGCYNLRLIPGVLSIAVAKFAINDINSLKLQIAKIKRFMEAEKLANDSDY